MDKIFQHSKTIKDEIDSDPKLKEMIETGRQQAKEGLGMTTKELVKTLTKEDFM